MSFTIESLLSIEERNEYSLMVSLHDVFCASYLSWLLT